jgi:hypothetical protein
MINQLIRRLEQHREANLRIQRERDRQERDRG